MIGTLLKRVRQYWPVTVLTPFFMLLEVAMEMTVPKLMASLINNGILAENMTVVFQIGGQMLICAVVGLFAGMMGGILGSKASTGFARNLRQDMFYNIQNFAFSNIDKYSTAGLVTRLTTDVTNVQNAFMMILRMCFRAPATLVVAMIMSFTISPRIASYFLIAVVILAIALAFMMLNAHKYFKQAFPKYDDLNASVQENVSAIRVVKAYTREEHEKKKFKKASNDIYSLLLKAENVLAMNSPIMMVCVYACILLISWLGAHMIVSSGETALTRGDLTSLLTYCTSILMSLMMLSMILIMVVMSVASMQRIAEVLNEKPDIVNPENPVMKVENGEIVFDHVNFSYKKGSDEFVLSDIDLTIHSGETIGIIGGTGSSKSSLVNLISRLYDVSEGSIRVGGVDVRDYDLVTLRDAVSVVLQKNVLFSGSILDNLRWGNKEATEEECRRACELACADEFIRKLPEGYNTHIEQGGNNVSGGQKQRLCIARALLKKPNILVLDDSTSAVDTATDAKIRKAFASEIPDTTKIIIAQRISSVQNADRIIVMEDGRVNGIGTHEELLATNEIYRDVYESQTGGNGDFDENGGDR